MFKSFWTHALVFFTLLFGADILFYCMTGLNFLEPSLAIGRMMFTLMGWAAWLWLAQQRAESEGKARIKQAQDEAKKHYDQACDYRARWIAKCTPAEQEKLIAEQRYAFGGSGNFTRAFWSGCKSYFDTGI